ncbi:YcxB family protein [Pleionea sp. CnH1-48]|uniref:YcxB family protein n=1 Tax=Pleionea sp. CnH1-48 TaxID=2954494 RepID=UPI00209684B8|nr:YcxB family protein [Pleionea sp. CnH1-48]MCO7222713.1 YcxB family protein [Pleionea sp. CnH1-48]
MEINIKLDKEDWVQYQGYLERELPKTIPKTWLDNQLVQFVGWLVIAVVFLVVFRQYTEFHWPTAISVAVFFILVAGVFIVNMLKIKKTFEPSDSGCFCGEHQFRFDDKGIHSEGNGYQSFHSWSIVKRIERSDGMIFIHLDTVQAYIFPESKLSNPDSFYEFVNEQYSHR